MKISVKYLCILPTALAYTAWSLAKFDPIAFQFDPQHLHLMWYLCNIWHFLYAVISFECVVNGMFIIDSISNWGIEVVFKIYCVFLHFLN